MVTFPATADQLRQDCASIRAFAERPAHRAMLGGGTRRANSCRFSSGPAASIAPAATDRSLCPRCLRAQARPLDPSSLADDRLFGCQSCGEVWMLNRRWQPGRSLSDVNRAAADPAATPGHQGVRTEAHPETPERRPAPVLEFRRRQSAA